MARDGMLLTNKHPQQQRKSIVVLATALLSFFYYWGKKRRIIIESSLQQETSSPYLGRFRQMSGSSVLRELPLPSPDSSNPASSSSNRGTQQDRSDASCAAAAPCCLCPHALAQESQIYGRTMRRKNNHHERATSSTWLGWKTSLAPHSVTQIVSNRDGTILAAATDGGTVSLLRGSDGKVIATRQVSTTSTHLAFVPRHNDQDGDTLLIQTPVSAEGEEIVNCVVVSNIQGAKLNGVPQSAAEASRQMKVRSLPQKAPGWTDMARVTALYKEPAVLLLVAVTLQGQFCLFDWNLEQGTLQKVTDNIPLKLSNDDKEWAVDYRLGFQTQPVYDQIYIVFCAYTPGAAALAWLNPFSHQCVSHIPLPVRAAQVGVFVPLPCFEATLAVGIAIQKDSTTRLHVYQVVVEETMGLAVLSKPHLVFGLPINCSLHEVSLATTLDEEVYTFAYQFWREGQPVVAEVHPTESSLAAIGKIRYLIKTDQFDEADKMLAAIGETDLDPLADFHPSEVSSARLQSLVSKQMPQPDHVHKCLQGLKEGAMTLNSTAVERFAQACEMISDRVLERPVDQQIVVIDNVLGFVSGAIDSTLPLSNTAVKDVETKLRDRKNALLFVNLVPKEDKAHLTGIRSTTDLLGKLLASKCYLLTEKLWERQEGQAERISVDQILEAIVKVPATHDPAGYLPLLKNTLFPNLTIHNDLLPILRAWACESADGMDENEVGLSAAISLLENVQDGIRGLQQRLHSSFATDSPFVEGLPSRTVKRQALGNISSRNLKESRVETSTKFHFGEKKTPTPIVRAPQTILRLGGLSSGASKSVVRTIGKWSTVDEIDEECVEQKLVAARCLHRARELGLPTNSLHLREFESTGCLEHCAQALVQTISQNAAENHEKRCSVLRGDFKTKFFDEFGCRLDDALLTYIRRLCKGATVSSRNIREAASVSLCCWTDENKATGTLAVVRAGLLCAYTEDWLLKQARQAIEWAASNSTLQSEMEEAARLLLIDSIICKYCGSAAREAFRVDNPKHATSLMDFVIRRVKKAEQIADILGLCDAFLHLAKRDSLVSVLRQGIMKGETQLCVEILAALYDRESSFEEKVLVGSVLVGALSFIVELLEEHCSMKDSCANPSEKTKATIVEATEAGCEIVSFALQISPNNSSGFDSDIERYLMVESLAELRDKFLRLQELQTRHDIFLSLTDLGSPENQITATFTALRRAMEAFVADNYKDFMTKVKRAERACMLLTGRKSKETQDIWKIASASIAESLLSKVDPLIFCKYLTTAGLFDGEQNGVACRALIRLAMSLCKLPRSDDDGKALLNEAFELSLACSLVRDHAIHICDASTLLSVIDVDSVLDSCHSILTMTDNGQGDKILRFREAIVALSSRNDNFNGNEGSDTWNQLGIHQPSLHRTWLPMDGLLLPPEQTGSVLKQFCDSTIWQSTFSTKASSDLQRLLSEKGANFARLRILNNFWSKYLVSSSRCVSEGVCEEVSLDFDNALEALAERSVGGSGVGMTSGVIDSELAVSFLLCLPMKRAFKIHTSTIPVAVKSQQYRRAYTLANVGTAMCTGVAGAIPENYRTGAWTKQTNLLEQFKNLSLQSSWWIRLSDLGVPFENWRFENPSEVSAKTDTYVASLVMPGLVTLSKRFDSHEVLKILSAFASDFKIDPGKVLECQVEYMVLPTSSDAENVKSTLDPSDSRSDIGYCEKMARHSLRRMRPLDRVRVLRRCVKSYELQSGPLLAYERYAVVLSLYREGLIAVLQKERTSIDPTPFEVELELVDCRRDALEILSSYFVGPRSSLRPDFLGFFVPFERIFGESKRLDNSHVTVLGCPKDKFDPLLPLRPAMLSSNNLSSSAALSPLFAALGLPQGYIHARFLLARFELSMKNDTSLPSFDNEVYPVLEKLRLPKDKALVSEWVAAQYSSQDEDRLRCFDLALDSAMKYSSEIEFRRRTTPGLAELETESLETVRRLTTAKSALSDKLRVVAILKSGISQTGNSLDRLITNLVSKLSGNDDESPERLIDFLLREASSLAAEWAVDASESLSMTQVRSLAELVNRVCTALSEQHSHIDPQRQARLLASGWLFRGNTDSDSPVDDDPKPAVAAATSSASHLSSITDDDYGDETLEFVLDLNDLRQNEASARGTLNRGDKQKTSDEEKSALRECSSREESEKNSRLASLRIAFVLAGSVDKSPRYDENMSPHYKRTPETASSKKRLGLLSKSGSRKGGETDAARMMAEQLLKVAFAKKVFMLDAFNDSVHSIASEVDGYNVKTITYAMRHRALRAAAVLCPQEILEEICENEAYLWLELEGEATTLQKCSFGAFLAKEIEEMGLQLPHSDLPQLSSMNFPAYARTLWRHNRDTSYCASRGRLLLLLTEMTLKDDKVDGEFLGFLLNEMRRIALPRTQLLSLERIAKSRHTDACKDSDDCRGVIWETLESTASAVLSESFSLSSSENTDKAIPSSAFDTISRLIGLMTAMCGFEQHQELERFVALATKLSSQTRSEQLKSSLHTAINEIERHRKSMDLTWSDD